MNAKLFKIPKLAIAAGMVAFACNTPIAAQNAPPPAVPSEELPAGSQVLTRGPVHEAFAKPVTMDPEAPVVVPKQPPGALQEIPPAEKPAGADIVWVPGYWAWDADRNDFIWVSGCWRNAPPQTYWVPGHWLQTANGWQWIGGFWKPITAQPRNEIEYLPAPPPAVEVAAPGSPPAPDQVWAPGCWYWSGGRYILRHGYWVTLHPGWVWVPSHYVWTPRGYIFCPGRWDYDLDDRGVLFTPAYFPAAVRVRAGFVFCPSICVDLGMLRLNLFVYPRYRHYCFGDYYDDAYMRIGIYPWFKCQTVHTWYDPLFVYDRWHFGRTEPKWAKLQAKEYQRLRSHRDLRPARTYTALEVQLGRLPASKRPERPLARPLRVFAASQSTPVKFERLNTTERQQISVRTTEVRDLRHERSQWESAGGRQTQVETRPSPVTTRRTEKETSRAKTVPMPEVRATRPEPVTVPRSVIPLKSSGSRYIEKAAPGRPTQEQYRSDTTSNPRSSDRNSRGKDGSAGSSGRGRDR